MDRTDLVLSRMMLEDSRAPYSEMAEQVGLSTQAVHRRIQALWDQGIIRRTIVRPSHRALGIMHVMVFGWSRATDMDAVARALARDPAVAVLQVASGNYVYVHGGIKDANELARLVTFVRNAANLIEPHVGIVHGPPPAAPGSLDRNDLRILSMLKDDARRPVSEISAALGMTPRTVRRRLNRMKDEGLAAFTIHWQPDVHGDTISKLHVMLRDDVEREKVALSMISRYSENIVNTVAFSNLPGLMLITLWTECVKEMKGFCRDIQDQGLVASVMPVVLLDIYYFRDGRVFCGEGELDGSDGPGHPYLQQTD